MLRFNSQAHERKKRFGFKLKTHTDLTTLKEQNERRNNKNGKHRR